MLLFRRHPRGLALTDAGRLFQVEALRLLQDMDAMKQRMARVAKGQAGRLAVGFTSSAAAHRFMPEALRAFRRTHPLRCCAGSQVGTRGHERRAGAATPSLLFQP